MEFGWEGFKARAGEFLLAQFVLLVPFALLQAAIGWAHRHELALISLLIPAMVWVCSMSLAQQVASGAKPDLEDAFRPFTARQGDYLVVCAAMSVGFVALGVGVLVSWFFCLFAPLCVLEGRDFKAALIESKDLVVSHPGDVARLAIVLFAINALAAVPSGLGLLVSLPVTTLAVIKARDQLAGRLPVSAPPATS